MSSSSLAAEEGVVASSEVSSEGGGRGSSFETAGVEGEVGEGVRGACSAERTGEALALSSLFEEDPTFKRGQEEESCEEATLVGEEGMGLSVGGCSLADMSRTRTDGRTKGRRERESGREENIVRIVHGERGRMKTAMRERGRGKKCRRHRGTFEQRERRTSSKESRGKKQEKAKSGDEKSVFRFLLLPVGTRAMPKLAGRRRLSAMEER
jgi:hypothetical protein